MPESLRNPNNGPYKYRYDTKKKLHEYVQKNCVNSDPDSLISTIDKFCWEDHWMVHMGGDKGRLIDDIILKYQPKTVLELGTYCGYSTIRMARLMDADSKVYTIDYESSTSSKFIHYSGLQNRIVKLEGLSKDILPTLTNLENKVDLILIDHDKKSYLPDLLLIEKYNLMHSNTVVIANSSSDPLITDYLNHVRNSDLYTSIQHNTSLEYSSTINDTIEVSIKN